MHTARLSTPRLSGRDNRGHRAAHPPFPKCARLNGRGRTHVVVPLAAVLPPASQTPAINDFDAKGAATNLRRLYVRISLRAGTPTRRGWAAATRSIASQPGQRDSTSAFYHASRTARCSLRSTSVHSLWQGDSAGCRARNARSTTPALFKRRRPTIRSCSSRHHPPADRLAWGQPQRADFDEDVHPHTPSQLAIALSTKLRLYPARTNPSNANF